MPSSVETVTCQDYGFTPWKQCRAEAAWGPRGCSEEEGLHYSFGLCWYLWLLYFTVLVQNEGDAVNFKSAIHQVFLYIYEREREKERGREIAYNIYLSIYPSYLYVYGEKLFPWAGGGGFENRSNIWKNFRWVSPLFRPVLNAQNPRCSYMYMQPNWYIYLLNIYIVLFEITPKLPKFHVLPLYMSPTACAFISTKRGMWACYMHPSNLFLVISCHSGHIIWAMRFVMFGSGKYFENS